MRDELRQQCRAIDEQLAEVPLPPALERRVMASVREPSTGSSRVLVGAAVLVAVVLAFALGLRSRPEPAPVATSVSPPVEVPILVPTPIAPPAPRLAWAGALTLDPQCDVASVGSELHVGGACRMTLAAPALAMETWSRTRLERSRDGVRVLAGEIQFAVEHVPAGAPRVRIDVAAGAIEVIGTRFAVVQEGDTGHVDLLEGAIAFVDREGAEHAVLPGRRLRWNDGRVVGTRERPADPERHATATAHPDDDIDATLEQVAALRRAGRYRDAVDVLHRARRRIGDAHGAEILSFEEGTLREHDAMAPAMCAFWRGHLARFPAGDYVGAVRSRIARAGCDDP